MSSDKATQTQNEVNDIEMADAQMQQPQPSDCNHTATPTTNFSSSWRNPATPQTTSQAAAINFRNSTKRCTMSQTPQAQHNLIQQFPSPAPTLSPNPQLRSPSPVEPFEPLEPLVPRGHGPCNRCGICFSRHFYQSKWEPERECCYECWEADRRRKGDDTLKEFRGRYFMRGVENADVEGVMEGKVPPARVVVREGWGLAALGLVEEWREREAAIKAELETEEGTEIFENGKVDESGDEIVVESPPCRASDGTVAVEAMVPAPPPSARFWDYKTEPKPKPGFKEAPVELLQTLTRSGKVTRRQD